MSLFLASSFSGQGFKMFKNFDLKSNDFNFLDNIKLDETRFSMIEFIPNTEETIKFSSKFECDIEEDEKLKTLNIYINTKKSVNNYPFLLTLKHYQHNKFDFNIDPSVYADSKKCMEYIKIIKRIKELHYRRIYIFDMEKNVILTSSCPNLNSLPHENLIKYYTNFEIIEKHLGEPIFPNRPYKKLTFDLLNVMAEKNSNLEYITDIDNIDKQTVIKVYYKGTRFIPIFISELDGWFNYNSMDMKFINKKDSQLWRETIKKQGPLTLCCDVRGIDPKGFCQNIIDSASSGNNNVLDIVNTIIGSTSINDNYETKITIDFHLPIEKIQLIDIIIEPADSDLNLLEQYISTKDYIKAIPLLEKFENSPENLAYAYTLNSDYDKALVLLDKILKNDPYSVAHMTKGLALVGKNHFNLAKEAYKLGTYLIPVSWYPEALNNLIDFIRIKKIEPSKVLDIKKILETPRKNLTIHQRCFCGSSKSIKYCHANEYFE